MSLTNESDLSLFQPNHSDKNQIQDTVYSRRAIHVYIDAHIRTYK